MRVLLLGMLLCAGLAIGGEPVACRIDTIAGGGIPAGDGGPAVDAELHSPFDIELGPDGLAYIADFRGHRVQRMTAGGTLETVAGTGEPASDGDGGLAVNARLRKPLSITFGPDGSLYVLEAASTDLRFGFNASRIRRIMPDGIISTVAGASRDNSEGDGGPAAEAGVSGTTEIAVGPDGSIYLMAPARRVVRRIRPDGIIERFAGNGQRGVFDDIGERPALDTPLSGLADVAVGLDGIVYIQDGNRILSVDANGALDLYLGGGFNLEEGAPREDAGFISRSGGLSIDDLGRLHWNSVQGLMRVSADDRVENAWEPGRSIGSVAAFSAAGNRLIYVRESQAFELLPGEHPRVIAGAGAAATLGDGGASTAAILSVPTGLAVGEDGGVYITDVGFRRIRRVQDGVITTVAGSGESGVAVDGGLAIVAAISSPQDVAVGPGGIYVQNGVFTIHRVRPDGILEKFTGGDTNCDERTLNDCGDGGPAVDASMDVIRDIAADRSGNVYILHDDRRNLDGRSIRKVTPDGIIDTISDRLPDGGRRGFTSAIAIDGQDRLLIATNGSSIITTRIWRVSEDEEYTLLEDVAQSFQPPSLLAFGGGDDVFAGRSSSIARASLAGSLNTMVLNGAPYSLNQGDGGPAQQAYIGSISGIAATEDALYFSDTETDTVRVIDLTNCPAVARPVIFQQGIVNAASFQAKLAPGTLFSVFGSGLGPAEGVGARLVDGKLAAEVGGVRVLVDDVPAPVVFASAGQVNAILPWSTEAEQVATVVVEYMGVASERRAESLGVFVEATAPAFFAVGDGLVAAINQDGSINGPDNPAARGSVVAFYGTGGGATEPLSIDGQVTGAELASPLAPVSLTIGGRAAQVLYAGTAPGLVAGVLQVNARIEDDAAAGLQSIVLSVGEAKSPSSLGMYVE